MAFNPSASALHVVLFPFMSKGHIIPILHLARLLLHRNAAVTIFTTPANRPFISQSLADTDTSVIDLPFPDNIDGVPAGVESTDRLPSMSSFFPFANATKLIQPHFELALQTLPNVHCIISDGFLGWTLQSASKFGIPRLVYYGTSNYFMAVSRSAGINRLLSGPESDDEPVTVPEFPWIKLTRNDFEAPFNEREPKGPHLEFIIEQSIATTKSYGLLVNSFHQLEPLYLDYWNRHCEPRAWCVGPLCLAEPPRVQPPTHQKPPTWMQWLDQKLGQGRSVLYVAFGSQAEISSKQLREISIGLEESKVNFLWVVRKNQPEVFDGFEERVKERGIVVREWVDQRGILGHESVQGFLSHCGWNSVVESICAKVPILAWPMMAEQHLNARMVAEEIKVGLRVETSNGSVRGFVKREGLEKMVRELMEGEMGKEVRKKVKEVGEAARKAMENVLVLIHVCIVGRAFRRGFGNTSTVENGRFGSRSMSQDDLEKLPCFDFKGGEKGSSTVDCAVCLDNFKVGDKCRLLPQCRHSFHAQCVDSWLLKTPICPICRTSADAGQKGGSDSGQEISHFSDRGIELTDSQAREIATELREGQTTERGHLSGIHIELRGSQTIENTNLSDNGYEHNENQTGF
ncbi:hypothetical protein F0562_004658 [Nyssa sinensis]|uniref:RING-type domain-containing protein n=1 Tax=Nyssa sinensis TaxID=561372 RepID=A0A5J5C3D8_9ASTE|nr:hypothetical protein F0562_004658 [Nyssa sinensis]